MADVVKRWREVTTLAMMVLGCGTWSTAALGGERSDRGEQQPRVIEITASRFEFTPSEIEVAVGERVRLLIRSADVEHGFPIPTLGIGTAIPPTGGPDAVADLEVDVLEPDFNLIALPTTLRLPPNKFAFRLTHRFSRPLDGGPGYGNLLEDFFGFDSFARMGLEFRYGLLPGTQIGVYRGNNRNIQIFGRQNLLWQRSPSGIGLDLQASIEGLNNLREESSGSVAAILSKRLGEWASLYAEPTWVGNVSKPGRFHPSVDDDDDDDSTFMLGLGTRLRVRPTVYLLGEYVPRFTGFDDGAHHISFAIEKRAGGHTFQLNVSNSLGTTPAQIAQGGSKDDWFIGFNIARKFY